jgi:hypothetical protein
MDVATVAALLREAEEHRGRHEATAPAHHCSDWYAPHIAGRGQGLHPDRAVEEATRHADRVRG